MRRTEWWQWVVAAAAVVAASALVLGQVLDDRQSDEDRAVSDCRSRLTALVSTASVERDIADASLNRADAALTLSIGAAVGVDVPADAEVLSLADALAGIESANRMLTVAERHLSEASAVRGEFELNPTGDC